MYPRFFFNAPAPTEIYTLSLHDALPIFSATGWITPISLFTIITDTRTVSGRRRSEEHTSELQSLTNLVCRLLLEKKKTNCAASIGHQTTSPSHEPSGI